MIRGVVVRTIRTTHTNTRTCDHPTTNAFPHLIYIFIIHYTIRSFVSSFASISIVLDLTIADMVVSYFANYLYITEMMFSPLLYPLSRGIVHQRHDNNANSTHISHSNDYELPCAIPATQLDSPRKLCAFVFVFVRGQSAHRGVLRITVIQTMAIATQLASRSTPRRGRRGYDWSVGKVYR
jgi:hypothetical protein